VAIISYCATEIHSKFIPLVDEEAESYRLGPALFDLDNPEHCLKRGDEWVLAPQEEYEIKGDVDNVIFPCGYTPAAYGDTILLYCGAADTFIAMATGSIS
jgi:predicted GH43/DUF377 family glycosyl hydrolase